MKLLWFKIVVALLAAVLLFSLIATERGLLYHRDSIVPPLHDRQTVAHLGSLKQPADMDLAKMVDEYGLHQVHMGSNFGLLLGLYKASKGVVDPPRWIDNKENYTTPAVGKSIKEIVFFGMPFGWYTDVGDVIFMRSDDELVYAQFNKYGLEAITKANDGQDVFAGRLFPFWAHAWGWLWIAGVGLATWLWFRAAAKRREELGLID